MKCFIVSAAGEEYHDGLGRGWEGEWRKGEGVGGRRGKGGGGGRAKGERRNLGQGRGQEIGGR